MMMSIVAEGQFRIKKLSSMESVQPFENESVGLFLSLPQFEADPRRTRHPVS